MLHRYLFRISFAVSLGTTLLPVTCFGALNASVTLDPVNPQPNSSVTLTLVSYSFDVNQSLITWTSSGKELLKGTGQKRLVVSTGGVGNVLPVHVSAVTDTGEAIALDIAVNPQSVSLLYESPESYVPLFYEGRSLPGEGSAVKFVAMPNISADGTMLPPSSLSYSWYVDDSFIDEASGIGKQSANIPLSILKNKSDVRVVARGPKGVTAETRMTIYPHAPLPLFYVYDDVLGVKLNDPVIRRFETTHPFTVSLEPYYLSANGSLGSSASYAWLLDGKSITPSGDRLLALKPKEDSYGSNNLSVSISSSLRRLQKGLAQVELIFDTRK